MCIGLLIDIAGITILFKWEPPVRGFTDEGNVIVTIEPTEDNKKEFAKNTTYSYVAIRLLVVGFAFQIVATIISLWV